MLKTKEMARWRVEETEIVKIAYNKEYATFFTKIARGGII